MKSKIYSLILFLLVTGLPLCAETIVILAPYAGPIIQNYDSNDLKSDGSGVLGGGYVQVVNPDYFQCNMFVYHSPEVNSTKVTGGHLNADGYFLNSGLGHFTAGAGVEYIDLQMDFGNDFSPLTDFTMNNRIFVNYYRAGYHFLFETPKTRISVFPWGGFQYDIIKGEMEFSVPMGPFSTMEMNEDIDETETYALAGLNLKLNLFHFVDLEAKYRAAFNNDDVLSTVSCMANIYVSKTLGFSYRFKYAEQTTGFETYHIFGVVIALRPGQ